MIKTYGDAIQFCESYPYTMEYFQLMKEAAQADLMGQMLLGQSYIQEKQSAGLFEEAARVVDNTFVEAMSDDDYLDLLIQYNESVGDVLRGIGHRLSTIFDSFLGLLRRARDFIKRHNPFRRNALDQIGIAGAVNKLSQTANGSGTRSVESVAEAYWAFGISNFMTLTPDIQVYINPGADPDQRTATVASLRATFMF